MGNENSSSYYSSTRDRAQVKDCPAMSFVFVFVFVLVFVFVGRSTSAQGTQSAVAEARRQTEGKYNIVCIKAGHNYDISGIMPTMYKSQVSFDALQNKRSNIHGRPELNTTHSNSSLRHLHFRRSTFVATSTWSTSLSKALL